MSALLYVREVIKKGETGVTKDKNPSQQEKLKLKKDYYLATKC